MWENFRYLINLPDMVGDIPKYWVMRLQIRMTKPSYIAFQMPWGLHRA